MALAGSQPAERERNSGLFCPARIFLRGSPESAARAATTPVNPTVPGCRESLRWEASPILPLSFSYGTRTRPDALCCPRRRLGLLGHEAPDWVVSCPLSSALRSAGVCKRPAGRLRIELSSSIFNCPSSCQSFSFAVVAAEAGWMPASAPYIPAELYPVLRPVKWVVMPLSSRVPIIALVAIMLR